MLDGDSDGYRGNDDSTKLFPSLQGDHYSACIGHLQQRSSQSHSQHSARLLNFYSLFPPTRKLVCTCTRGCHCPARCGRDCTGVRGPHRAARSPRAGARGLSTSPPALGVFPDPTSVTLRITRGGDSIWEWTGPASQARPPLPRTRLTEATALRSSRPSSEPSRGDVPSPLRPGLCAGPAPSGPPAGAAWPRRRPWLRRSHLPGARGSWVSFPVWPVKGAAGGAGSWPGLPHVGALGIGGIQSPVFSPRRPGPGADGGKSGAVSQGQTGRLPSSHRARRLYSGSARPPEPRGS